MSDILIISNSRNSFSTKEISKALKKKNASFRYIKTTRIRVCADQNEALLLYRNELIEDVGSVIPRIGRSLTDFAYIVLRHFERIGIPSTLSSRGLIHARNKFMAVQELINSGIPFPTSWLAASRMKTGTIKQKMKFPIIIKLLSGTQGIGVMRVESEENAIPIIDTLTELDQLILIQKYLEDNGEDIRAFVVDEQVVASMKRISPEGDWRANIHAGGKGVAYTLTEEEEEIVIKSTKVLDTGIAGVDIIQTPDGPMLIEVNVSPGFKGLLEATGVNVADSIAEYAIRLAKK
jgi:ribosomal protein S6--L-glutamate ligase